jgi:hypothetical protein
MPDPEALLHGWVKGVPNSPRPRGQTPRIDAVLSPASAATFAPIAKIGTATMAGRRPGIAGNSRHPVVTWT